MQLLWWLRLVMELLGRLLMEVMVMHLILLLTAHFQVHILPPSSSTSASTTSTSTSSLNAEAASYRCSAQLSQHPSWSVRLGHRTYTWPTSWPGRTFSLGSSGLSAPLLGSILRQKRV